MCRCSAEDSAMVRPRSCSRSASFNRMTRRRAERSKQGVRQRADDLGRFATGRQRGQRRDADQWFRQARSRALRPPIDGAVIAPEGVAREPASRRSCIAVRAHPSVSNSTGNRMEPKDDVSIHEKALLVGKYLRDDVCRTQSRFGERSRACLGATGPFGHSLLPVRA
jgi:hypothetical protein